MPDQYAAWAARWRVPLGLVLAVAYLILAEPTPRLLWIGGSLALVGLAIRAAAAGHLEKNAMLATGGPYAYTRNPLYLGSFLLGFGLAMAGNSLVILIAFVALFIFVYWPVMRREEQFLRSRFGELYQRYAQQTPFFLPALSQRFAATSEFSWRRYQRNREYEAALGYCAGLAFLIIKMLLRSRR